jgi:hypothetical protein
MTVSSFLALLPMLLGLTAVGAMDEESAVRRLIVNDELIVKVPVQPQLAPRAFEWVEREGPKCISTRSIRGAMLSGSDNVDFLLIARQRVRAEFGDDCPALDFYGGFYLKPEDEKLCAGRDSIHSRIGGSCRIEGFAHLVPRVRH